FDLVIGAQDRAAQAFQTSAGRVRRLLGIVAPQLRVARHALRLVQARIDGGPAAAESLLGGTAALLEAGLIVGEAPGAEQPPQQRLTLLAVGEQEVCEAVLRE